MGTSNQDLLQRAADVFPGASLGSYFMPDGLGFVVGGGRGTTVYDVEGKEYLDYLLGGGPMILGHAHPTVVGAVQEQLERGTSYYALNEPSILLAEKIVAAAPCAETLKFCSSGSEATFYSLRLARTATQRSKIMKFEGGYHGHHDFAQMSWAPSKLQPFPRATPDCAGILKDISNSVLVAPFNDLEMTMSIIEAHKHDLAAVIVEPGCRLIDPKPGFLEGLREATSRLGIVLIFDEVVTGFRVAYGGAQELYGVIPDLACYGKIIGGGYPLAAVAGKREIMKSSNPKQRDPSYSYISGTLNGNAIGATAGLATLAELEKPGVYTRLNNIGQRMRNGMKEIAERLGIPAQVLGTGPMANIYFTSTPIVDYRSSVTVDKSFTQKLGRALLEHGILAHLPAKLYLSTLHTDSDVDTTLDRIDESIRSISNSN